VAATLRPVSPPAPPGNLSFALEGNDQLAVACPPPTDSGDTSPLGVPLAAYRLRYRPAGSAQWTALTDQQGGPGGAVFYLSFLPKSRLYNFKCAVTAQQVRRWPTAGRNPQLWSEDRALVATAIERGVNSDVSFHSWRRVAAQGVVLISWHRGLC
jgi:hypothetical protein